MKKSLVASTRGGELLEVHRVAVPELARRDALALRRLGDRLAVLVGAGEEEHVLAALAHVAGQHVGRDRRVGVAQMGLAVHVVDRRGDVVRTSDSDATRALPDPGSQSRAARSGPGAEERDRQQSGNGHDPSGVEPAPFVAACGGRRAVRARRRVLGCVELLRTRRRAERSVRRIAGAGAARARPRRRLDRLGMRR